MRKIVLDTNFLLLPAELGLDIYSELERLIPQEHELVTIPCVRAELENLVVKNKKLKLALSMMAAKGVRIEHFSMGSLQAPKETLPEQLALRSLKGPEETPIKQLAVGSIQKPGETPNTRFKKEGGLKGSNLCDQAVLSFAAANDAVVCTLDRELKLAARSRGVVVVHMVGRSHLGFFGAIG